MHPTTPVAIVGPVPGEGWTSIERYTAALSAMLQLSEGEHTLAPAPPSCAPNAMAGYRLRYRDYPRTLARHVAETDPGLVHITDQALGHLAAEAGGRTVVLTCHDLMPLVRGDHYRSRMERWFDLTLLHMSLGTGMEAAHRIIAVSRTTAEDIVRELDVDPQRIAVVPNVVDDVFRVRRRPRPWLAAQGIELPEGPIVLSAGSTRPNKNLGALADAMTAPVLRGATLVRAGQLLPPELRARVPGVVELGPVNGATLSCLYAAADVVAVPSRYEGFGLPAYEAMACGTPVVCSDGGALREVPRRAALVAPQEDDGVPPPQLAEALGRVLDDPRVAAGLRRAGLACVQAFRAEAVAPRLVETYREATRERVA